MELMSFRPRLWLMEHVARLCFFPEDSAQDHQKKRHVTFSGGTRQK